MIDLTDLYQLIQAWCASLDEQASNYLEAAIGRLLGFNYQYPLTEEQSKEILTKIHRERPDLYEWGKRHPRREGWITKLEDVLPN